MSSQRLLARFEEFRVPLRRGLDGMWVLAVGVFLLVAGAGAATSLFGVSSSSAGFEQADDEILARLQAYVHSIGPSAPPPALNAAAELLPDVETMIGRLVTRLAAAPDDIKGWQMLGWSYFNTERYEEAARAYGRAVALDPSSASLKLSYEEAKSMASDVDRSAAAGGISPPHATE